MRIVIEFLYDDDVTLNRENVYNLLSAADFLQISILKEACLDYLENGRNWKEAVPMKKPRYDISAVAFNDQIFAIGGDQDELTSVELYDPRANAWCDVAFMTKRNLGHVYACVANGKIYAMDDKDQSVKVYDPVVDEWKEVPPTTDDQTNDDEFIDLSSSEDSSSEDEDYFGSFDLFNNL
ncbi:unnamed protein product [Clavelina lepadiformis]|uniref:BTB domain-containing protein n=1 Tax=Clavelina lepadiformis TaxID=159417 RepID=A0ABP0GNE8_CLALP